MSEDRDRWYNGFSPEQQSAAGLIQKAAVKAGDVPRPTTCSICGAVSTGWSDNPVWFHDEDYSRPLASHHICRRCHVTLHRRFDDPGPWQALVARHGSNGAWFEALTMDSQSRWRPLAETYPPPVLTTSSFAAAVPDSDEFRGHPGSTGFDHA